jgi:hypothetical protein
MELPSQQRTKADNNHFSILSGITKELKLTGDAIASYIILRIRNVQSSKMVSSTTHRTFHLDGFDTEESPFHFYRCQDFPPFRIAIRSDKLAAFLVC